MQKTKSLPRAALALLLTLLIAVGITAAPGMTTTAEAASNLTSIGLAEHALKAYRDGWQYYYGGYGNFGSNGVRNSDCSGLVYSYFCWVDDNSNIKPDYSYPRTVTAQVNASVESGPISTIPRTHGLIVTIANYDHVGVYLGNGMVADNSTWGVNMRYQSITRGSWLEWHKLGCITYPTTGWYQFDGDYFYYENGEYIVNTTRTLDGTTYTFGSDGIADKTPSGATNEGFGTSSSSYNAKTTADVRLRSGAGTSYSTLTVLANGSNVNVTSTANSAWYAVTTPSGQKGYVYSQYINLTGTVPESDSSSSSSSGSSTTTGNSATVTGTAAKTTTAVHLRSGRGTSYSSLGVISSGTSITVTDTSNSSWYGVTANGKSGYMYSEYIKMDSTSNSSSSSSSSSSSESSTSSGTESKSAKTTADVNLRSGRGTNYSSKGVIANGTSITVTDTSNSSWYGVTANGKTGYMFSQYIKLTESTSSSSTSSESSESTESSASSESSSTESSESSASGSSSTSGKTTTYVNLRSGRGTNYSSLGVISTGTALTITDTSDSAWYGVTVNGKSGYMYSQYISTTAASSSTSGSTAMKTTAYLNLRSGAGTGNAVLTVMPQGASVTLVEKTSADWYKVTYNGTTGYCAAQYLR